MSVQDLLPEAHAVYLQDMLYKYFTVLLVPALAMYKMPKTLTMLHPAQRQI